jgi:hypothetical protein
MKRLTLIRPRVVKRKRSSVHGSGWLPHEKATTCGAASRALT